MLTQQVRLSDDRVLDITVNDRDGCVTVSQQLFINGVRAKSKTCTVTCSTGKSHTWTCSDDKDCEGDCSDPHNPKGRCY